MAKTVIEFVILGRNKLTGPMSKSAKSVDRMRRIVEKTRRSIFNLRGAFIALGAVGIAKSFIDAANTSEQFQVKLRVLLGSVEEGNKLFSDMAEFAGSVPFQFEEIMNSATQLSGVMTGGTKEIKQFMPLIGDLAAVTGLTIQETTGQIIRMYSAGAASADLFRERGILAMLGFQAGVSVSAKETRKRLLAIMDDPTAKFKGASKLLATTLLGAVSMVQDKWFTFRTLVMDAGIMNMLKAIVGVIDTDLGDSIKNAKDNFATFKKEITSTLNDTVDGIAAVTGVFADGFRGVAIAIKTVQSLWKIVVSAIKEDILRTTEFLNALRITSIDTKGMEDSLHKTRTEFIKVSTEMQNLMLDTIPSEGIKKKAEEIKKVFNELQTATTSENKAAIEARKQAEAAAAQNLLELKQQFLDTVTKMDFVTWSQRKQSLESRFGDELSINQELLDAKVIGEEEHRANIEAIERAHQTRMREIGLQAQEFNLLFMEELRLQFEETVTLNQELAESMADIITGATDQMSQGIADVIVDGKKMSDVMRKIGKTILKTLITMMIQLAAKRLVLSIMNIKAEGKEASAGIGKAVGLAGANGVASWAGAPWPISLGAPAFGIAMAGAAAGIGAAGIGTGAGIGATVAAREHGGPVTAGDPFLVGEAGAELFVPGNNGNIIANNALGGGDTINISQLTVEIMPNVTSADTLRSMSEDELAEEIGVPVIRAIDRLFDQGSSFKFVEQQ